MEPIIAGVLSLVCLGGLVSFLLYYKHKAKGLQKRAEELMREKSSLMAIRGGAVVARAIEQRLREALSKLQKRRIVGTERVAAAVLVPIFYKQGQYYILFIKRTERMRQHKGEISFPGGGRLKTDKTLLDTALRECAEEIGLPPGEVEVLGQLDDTPTTTSGYVISPFVGLIPYPYEFKGDEWEVEEIIEVPISALLDKERLQQKTTLVKGKEVTSYAYQYQGRIVWGATAEILRQFLDICARLAKR